MKTVTVGLYLPCGVNVTPEPIFLSDETAIINAVSDGTSVVGSVATNCDSDKILFVGYFPYDEVENRDNYNYLATNLFRKELFGNCVVVWGLNDNGVEDGEIHTIPDDLYDALTVTLTESTATAYNMSVGMAGLLNYSIDNGIIDSVMEETIANALTSHMTKEAKMLLEKVVKDVYTHTLTSDDPIASQLNEFANLMLSVFDEGWEGI